MKFPALCLRSLQGLLLVLSLFAVGSAWADPATETVEKARALMTETKFQECLDTLQPLLAVSQNDVEVQYLAGLAKVMLKDYQGSLEPLQQAKALDPADPQIRYLLGRAYAELGDLPHALAELEAVFGKAPTTPDLGYHLGKVHYQDTQYPPARDVLNVAVSSHELMKQKVHFLLGLSYERLGDKAKADENLRVAANIAPDTELGKGIAKRLAGDDGKSNKGSSGETAPTAPLLVRKKFGLDAYASLLYDDNARLDPKAHPTDPTVAFLRSAPGSRSDAGFNLAVRPEYSFHDKGGERASVSYFGSHTSYFDLDAVDFSNHQLALNWFDKNPENENSPLFAASVAYDYSELGDRHFLDRFTFSPSITIQSADHPERGTVIYGLLSRRDFALNSPNIAGENRDGTLASLGATQYHFFGNGRHNVRAGLLIDRDNTRGDNYDYDGIRPALGASFSTWEDATLSLDAFYHVRDYDAVNSVFGRTRIDHDTRVIGRLSKPIKTDLTAFAEVSLNDVRSSVPVFAFERDAASLGVHYRY